MVLALVISLICRNTGWAASFMAGLSTIFWVTRAQLSVPYFQKKLVFLSSVPWGSNFFLSCSAFSVAIILLSWHLHLKGYIHEDEMAFSQREMDFSVSSTTTEITSFTSLHLRCIKKKKKDLSSSGVIKNKCLPQLSGVFLVIIISLNSILLLSSLVSDQIFICYSLAQSLFNDITCHEDHS